MQIFNTQSSEKQAWLPEKQASVIGGENCKKNNKTNSSFCWKIKKKKINCYKTLEQSPFSDKDYRTRLKMDNYDISFDILAFVGAEKSATF